MCSDIYFTFQWLADAAPHYYEWKGKPLPTEEEAAEKKRQDEEKEKERALRRQIRFVMKYTEGYP